MFVFDLKSLSYHGQTFTNSSKGPANVQRSISLLATNGFFYKTRFQQMRSSVSRQSSNKVFVTFGVATNPAGSPSNQATAAAGPPYYMFGSTSSPRGPLVSPCERSHPSCRYESNRHGGSYNIVQIPYCAGPPRRGAPDHFE